jgi:hypothetical protein
MHRSRVLCTRAGRPQLRRARATRDGTVPDAPGVRTTGKRRIPLPLAVVASGLLVVGLLHCPVTIDDHAVARGWIAGMIAAIGLGRADEGGIRSWRLPAIRLSRLPARRPSATRSGRRRRPPPRGARRRAADRARRPARSPASSGAGRMPLARPSRSGVHRPAAPAARAARADGGRPSRPSAAGGTRPGAREMRGARHSGAG